METKEYENNLIKRENSKINKEYKIYEDLNGFYLKITHDSKNLKIVIYNIEKLDGIKFQIVLNLHELNNYLKNVIDVKKFYNMTIDLMENKKYEIKYNNDKDTMILTLLYKNILNKEEKIEIILFKENKDLNEFNKILLHEIKKLRINNNEILNEIKKENEIIKENINNIKIKLKPNIELINYNTEQKEIIIYDKNYGNKIFEYLKKIELEDIKELKLYNNNITDITNINILNLENLKILGLNDNKIKEINIINRLDSLEELWLSNNLINNIDFLGNMTTDKLKKLDLSMNNILDISIFQNINLINLNELYLYKNLINDISIFENTNLLNLNKLDLSLNNIVDINVFTSQKDIFKQLKELDLSHNKIKDISCFYNVKYNYLYQYIRSSKLNELNALFLNYNNIDINKYNDIILYLQKKLNLKIKYQNI